jgi:hypothetical protein
MTEWLDTVPVTDRAKINAAFKIENEAMKRRMKRPYIPEGCDQQGRVEPGWQQSGFGDGRGEWELLGMELLAVSAVVVIALIAWLV